MLILRSYSIECPCCRNLIDIHPPDSLAAEQVGLTHRCPRCRRLLATSVVKWGPLRIPEVMIIGPSDRSFEPAQLPRDSDLRRNLSSQS